MRKAKSFRYLIAAAAGFCGTQACTAADDNKQLANEANQRMAFYQEEASKLNTTDVFKEIQRQQAIQDAKPKGTVFLDFSEDTYKTIGYLSELAKRRNQNESLASFYHGLYNWRVCAGLAVGLGKQNSAVQTCWQESLASYKVASRGLQAPPVGGQPESGIERKFGE
jgi:hypothetical protein